MSRPPLRTALALVAATLVTGACGGGHHSGVTTAGGPGAASSVASGSYDQDFIDFAHCMRDHGISNFPDPAQRPGHSGLSLQFPDGFDRSVDPDKAAYDACVHLIQAVIDMKQANVAAQLTPEKLQALLAYSHCMRDHQIPLLDPDPTDGHISFGAVTGLSDPPGGRRDPLFAAADGACRNLLPADVPDDGTGPP